MYDALTTVLPKYTFHITEGPQVQQILVGIRQGITAFFTQKTTFKSGVSLLRPGALLTVTIDGESYPLLFLHTKSGTDPRGLGLRDDMLNRALDFAKVLDRAAAPGKRANYIFLGDFNIMGMEFRFVRESDLPAAKELLKLQRAAKSKGMRVLEKDAEFTWWGGGSIDPSSLDFVVARSHLVFKRFGEAEVSVRGWPQLPLGEERLAWVRRYSDHALLYFEVQRV